MYNLAATKCSLCNGMKTKKFHVQQRASSRQKKRGVERVSRTREPLKTKWKQWQSRPCPQWQPVNDSGEPPRSATWPHTDLCLLR